MRGSFSLVQQFFQAWVAAQEAELREAGRYRRGRRATRSNEPKIVKGGSGKYSGRYDDPRGLKPKPTHTAALRASGKKARPFVGKNAQPSA